MEVSVGDFRFPAVAEPQNLNSKRCDVGIIIGYPRHSPLRTIHAGEYRAFAFGQFKIIGTGWTTGGYALSSTASAGWPMTASFVKGVNFTAPALR